MLQQARQAAEGWRRLLVSACHNWGMCCLQNVIIPVGTVGQQLLLSYNPHHSDRLEANTFDNHSVT
jgi:hypothetical protein